MTIGNDCISIVGLGKLGLPLAASFADRGFHVIGVDTIPAVVEGVNAGRAHVYEPGLLTLLRRVVPDGRLRATCDLGEAVRETDATVILVPTPSQEGGAFANEYVLQVCEALGRELAQKEGYHLVVVSSTVMPGSCGGAIRETLERGSGRAVGKDLGLCYCPEFVALGNAIGGFQRPDSVLIGQSDNEAGGRLEAIYRQFCVNGPPIVRRSLVNAEIAKMALNFAVTAKITVANTLAEICEGLPGADVDEVTSAIGYDKRIGHKYLTGGPAFGGACFPRDVRALMALAAQAGTWATLAEAVHEVNQYQNARLIAQIDRCLEQGVAVDPPVVGVLGLAFKPGTDVTEESVGMALLEKYGDRCVVYDPLAACGQSVHTAQDCVDRAGVVVVTITLDGFRDLAFRPGQAVIDCWRWLDGEKVRAAGARYIGIGLGPEV